MTTVFAVGSNEERFVVDRIYDDLQKAIDYCESRANARHEWVVLEAPIGGDWITWKCPHRTPRKTA